MAPHQEPREDRREPPPLRAAEYVPMSTDHQQYSTENQAETIREYAERHGLLIVRSYADEGKSGLRLEGRDQLQRLIADVESGGADFQVVLVYDVSRWGRFQDADESAYYEYLCRGAGIEVHYCAEQFENDGGPAATIIKSVKRAMAGEYSRELSAKVFQGQCRLIELGYRQGGAPGYGLRRMLVNQAGEQKGVLHRGEQKSLQTDRVILVPGPEEEVRVVRWIYEQFTALGRRESEIAAALNARGLVTDLGRPWTRGTVQQVLNNKKYIGNNVCNRTSFNLKRKHVRKLSEPTGDLTRPGDVFLSARAPRCGDSTGLPPVLLLPREQFRIPRRGPAAGRPGGRGRRSVRQAACRYRRPGRGRPPQLSPGARPSCAAAGWSAARSQTTRTC
jgi:DNA invertase Pin-like site-specific DNA recombinase